MSSDARKAAYVGVVGSGVARNRREAGPSRRQATQMLSAGGLCCPDASSLRFLGGWLGRRITYAGLCIGSMIAIYGLYQLNDPSNVIPRLGIHRGNIRSRVLRMAAMLRTLSDAVPLRVRVSGLISAVSLRRDICWREHHETT
jgi:hypothetical protein